MKLMDQTLADFSGLLASESPTPGGGSAAALEAVLGVSLVIMAAGITSEKKAYLHRKDDLGDIIKKAETLRQRLLELVDEDTVAYQGLMAARSLGEDAYQEALKKAILPPHSILQGALEGLGLVKQLSSDYYLQTASDLGLAAQSLKAAAQGAELTILMNLRSLSDGAFGKQYGYESHIMLEESLSLAEELYDEIRSSLMS